MPAIPMQEAVERLAKVVEKASSEDLVEIHAELYPEKSEKADVNGDVSILAAKLARHIREELAPEEAVDLWNVVFPTDRDVHYNEEHALKEARERMEDRFKAHFQRRHDCIHNCDRPRVSPQPLSKPGTVFKVIEDVKFFVNRCDEHINEGFRQFLEDIGCSASTIGQANY